MSACLGLGEVSPGWVPSTFHADSFWEGAMNWSRIATAMAAACLAAYPAGVLAADSTLVLVVGGEAYDGPPTFEVDFDGKSLGKGTVAAAIDSKSAGRFADATDKTPYVQSFTFAVPDSLFRADGNVTVRLLNGATPQDAGARSLYLASIALNGRTVTASGLTSLSSGGSSPGQLLGEFLVIPDGTHEGQSKAPTGGWPSPQPGITTVALPISAQADSPDLLPTGSIGTDKVGESDEPLAVATIDPDPEGGMAQCDLGLKYNVVGFNENSNALTPRLAHRLDQVVADIGDRHCKVQVTGYSSKHGVIASNALFAIERAQNSLRYLEEHGVKFAAAIATGGGATDQFGPDDSLNRRVVITIAP
jgi:outer membrane protein OmpA-like peptidoglycan-associated protein